MDVSLSEKEVFTENSYEDLEVRRDLAYAYRILASIGMDDHTYTHLSARPEGADYYYIYPFGYMFEEVNEDCFIKISLDGEILKGHEDICNKTAYIIHGCLYKSRPDLNSIFHLHTISSVAVSAMKKGLLPISQWAMHFYNKVAYHEYHGLVIDEKEQGEALVKDFYDKKIMFLRNHGFITSGKTIKEAMFYSYHLELACKAQVAALSMNSDLVIPSHEICSNTCDVVLNFEKDIGDRDWKAWVRKINRLK